MALNFLKRKKKTDGDASEENTVEQTEQEPAADAEPAETSDAAPEDGDAEAATEEKPSILKKILKAALFLLLLAVLIVVGFGAGVYMRVIDGNAASEQLKKHDIPILGEYLAKIPLSPETKDEPTEAKPPADDKVSTDKQPAVNNDAANNVADKDKEKDKNKDKEKKQSKTIKLTKEEIEKQTKEREAAEKKRVSKLARLYTNMKAKEAADALVNLDDNMIIAILQRMEEGQAAKILAQFDPERTAQITRIMFVGVQQRVTVPADLTENGEE